MHKFVIWFAAVVIVLFSLVMAGCGGGRAPSANQGAPAGQGQPGSQSSSANQGASGNQDVAGLLAKGKQIQGMQCDYSMTASNVNVGGKMWVSGGKFRNEVAIAGQKAVMIFDGTTLYNYSPDQNVAYKVTNPSKKAKTPLDYANDLGQIGNVQMLETAALDGVQCRVIQYPSPYGNGDQVKMWVREDYGIPVRVETTTGGEKMVMEFKNLTVGPQPDSLFQLPAGAKVKDLGDITKNTPQ